MHESITCPRCGNQFECKPGNITQCGCYGFTISADIRKELEKYDGCVCANCLQELTTQTKTSPSETQNPKLETLN